MISVFRGLTSSSSGQTGTGKTYTMFGGGAEDKSGWRSSCSDPAVPAADAGIAPRAIQQICAHVRALEARPNVCRVRLHDSSPNLAWPSFFLFYFIYYYPTNVAAHVVLSGQAPAWSLSCSFLELHHEHLRDLLAPALIAPAPASTASGVPATPRPPPRAVALPPDDGTGSDSGGGDGGSNSGAAVVPAQTLWMRGVLPPPSLEIREVRGVSSEGGVMRTNRPLSLYSLVLVLPLSSSRPPFRVLARQCSPFALHPNPE